ncbi:MAG: hypothetical protein ACK5LY_00485 [Lachnospirales bacterium]
MAKANKKNSSSATIITILILILCIIAICVGVYLKMKEYSELPVDQGEILLEKNLETDYPESPKAVVEYYYDIYKYLYSGEADVTYTSELIWQMRLMYTRELQVLNPYEIQKEAALEEIVEGQTYGVKMLTYELQDLRYDDANSTIAYVTVKEYWSGIQNFTKEYALYLEDGDWKIHRWDILSRE